MSRLWRFLLPVVRKAYRAGYQDGMADRGLLPCDCPRCVDAQGRPV